VIRIVAAAAVADADIEKAVWTEPQRAAVVIRKLRMPDHALACRPPEIEPRRRIGHERVGRRLREARDDDVAVEIGEVDEEPPVDRGI
jgi:hypothetical protein